MLLDWLMTELDIVTSSTIKSLAGESLLFLRHEKQLLYSLF